ncbi:MAG: Fe(2+)-trafficking protein, partial [Phycisphaerales bacterium]|nr:Fe(2+)-trafficking protein [Phycisphaerales bacterium]
MADASKIEKFQQAVEADPHDELANFSLGAALMEADRADEAGPCFQRVLAVNPQHSKAHEMLARAQIKTGHTDLAIDTLRNGYQLAHRKGDVAPAKAMAALLEELGEALPETTEKKAPESVGVQGDGSFVCRRCGGNGPRLEKTPFKGDLGQLIADSVCQMCWTQWVGQGTKVINELRLPMYDPKAQEMYDRHMKEFL